MNAYTKDKKYCANITENGERFIATAYICDGQSYGGDSYWFHIGSYKTLSGAQKGAIKQMSELGKEIKF